MKLVLNIEKKHLIFLSIFLVLIGAGFVIAQQYPAIIGHEDLQVDDIYSWTENRGIKIWDPKGNYLQLGGPHGQNNRFGFSVAPDDRILFSGQGDSPWKFDTFRVQANNIELMGNVKIDGTCEGCGGDNDAGLFIGECPDGWVNELNQETQTHTGTFKFVDDHDGQQAPDCWTEDINDWVNNNPSCIRMGSSGSARSCAINLLPNMINNNNLTEIDLKGINVLTESITSIEEVLEGNNNVGNIYPNCVNDASSSAYEATYRITYRRQPNDIGNLQDIGNLRLCFRDR